MTTPALRDQYGQHWPFPPVEGPDQPAVERTWLIFIPGAYTPVCMSELERIPTLVDTLAAAGVAVRLIAPDSAPVLRMVCDQLGLTVPFLSDFWPHGAAASHYDVLDLTTGRPKRVSLLVDRSGEVLETLTSKSGSRNMDDHLSVLHNEK